MPLTSPLCPVHDDVRACTRPDGHSGPHYLLRPIQPSTVDLSDWLADLDARYGTDPAHPFPQGPPLPNINVQVAQRADRRKRAADRQQRRAER